MVVPDDVTIGKLPQINGLLAYQKDAKAFRFRKNGTWKEIAEKEVILYFTIIIICLLLFLLTKTFNLVHLEPLAKHKQEIGTQTTAK